jgi:chromosomal replication initiator protein
MDAKRAWEATLGELELQMTKATFDTWLKNTNFVSYEDGTFVVGVPNAYAKDWLRHRLLSTIKETLTRIAGETVEIKFALTPKNRGEEQSALLSRPAVKKAEAIPQVEEPILNSKYTFKNFVVGNSNMLAHAATVAVSENPAHAYNPLFIYGGVGLGKTHLLQALGAHYLDQGMKIIYIPAETFTNDMVNAIRTQTTDDFRSKYRSGDALLIDDVQFIAGKESTQEEMFHTFNWLYESNRQIVLSSDRPPKAISPLESRLRSRFEWGLLADIQPPDLETRIAILEIKAEEHDIALDNGVLELIAHKINTNIRELEGALNRLVAYKRMLNVPLSPGVVEDALGDILERPRDLNFDQILEAVSEYYAVPETKIVGKRRDKDTAHARHVVMYLAREETPASLSSIGNELGGRDHTTISHGHDKIESLIETDDQLRQDVFSIREALRKAV